jgi:hypothetical protein
VAIDQPLPLRRPVLLVRLYGLSGVQPFNGQGFDFFLAGFVIERDTGSYGYVYRVNAQNRLERIAGNNRFGFEGDGGIATSASIRWAQQTTTTSGCAS